jgi:hypothetical protein
MNLYFDIMVAAYQRAASKIVGEQPHDPTPPWVPMTRDELVSFGLAPVKPMVRTAAQLQLKGVPRYSNLAIYVKSALFGLEHPSVQRMIDRNQAMYAEAALSAATP